MDFTLTHWSLKSLPCVHNEYLEIRDGHNQSANVLGVHCGEYVTGVVRSSGRNMWLKFSPRRYRYTLHALYRGKAFNETGKYKHIYIYYLFFLLFY